MGGGVTEKQGTSHRHQRSTSHNNPVILIPNAQIASQGMKIRKSDLKLLQQYCEQNELGMVEMGQNMQSSKASKVAHKSKHHKTKSTGATPLGGQIMHNIFQGRGKVNNFAIETPSNAVLPKQSPGGSGATLGLDYQKYLHGEQIYTQKKSKSQLGYYSQQQTPVNGLKLHNQVSNIRTPIPGSKSPDPISQANNQQLPFYGITQKQSRFVENSNQDMGSQSVLQNYPNAAQIMSTALKRGNSNSQETRQGLRKKQLTQTNNQSTAPTSIATQGGMPSTINSNKIGGPTSLFQKSDKNTIDDNPNLNESSQLLYDDPLAQSNQYFYPHNRSTNNYLYEESYNDNNNMYEQFIQGPHHMSDYQAQLEELKSYKPSSQRPSMALSLSQQKSQSKYSVGRQTPTTAQQAKLSSYGRTQNQQMQRSSKQNSGKTASDRRPHFVGRTPSPNLFKKSPGAVNGSNLADNISMYKQQQMLSNATSKNLIRANFSSSQHQSKRSISKQQYTTGGAIATNNNGSGQIVLGANIIQSLNKTLKQKFIKQYGSAQGMKYQSGSVTTTFNSAANSPVRSGSLSKNQQSLFQNPKQYQQQLQVNGLQPQYQKALTNQPTQAELFEYMSSQSSQQFQQQLSQNQLQQQQVQRYTHYQQNQAQQQQQQQQDPFHKKQLRMINQQEEKRALAMISSISSTQKNLHDPLLKQQFLHPLMLNEDSVYEDSNYQQQQQHPYQQQINPKLYNTEDYAKESVHEAKKIQSIQKKLPQSIPASPAGIIQNVVLTKSLKSSGGNPNSGFVGNILEKGGDHQQILDGGTGSNEMILSNALLNSHNSSLANMIQYNDVNRQSMKSQKKNSFVYNEISNNENVISKNINVRKSQQIGLKNQQQQQSKQSRPQSPMTNSSKNTQKVNKSRDRYQEGEQNINEGNGQINLSSNQINISDHGNNVKKGSVTSSVIQNQKDMARLQQQNEILESADLFQMKLNPQCINNQPNNNINTSNVSQGNNLAQVKQNQTKKAGGLSSVERPKIQAPSIEMYKPHQVIYDSQVREVNTQKHNNNQKRPSSRLRSDSELKQQQQQQQQQQSQIKSNDIKIINSKSSKHSSQQQMPAPPENSISILKQLQDSFKDNPLSYGEKSQHSDKLSDQIQAHQKKQSNLIKVYSGEDDLSESSEQENQNNNESGLASSNGQFNLQDRTNTKAGEGNNFNKKESTKKSVKSSVISQYHHQSSVPSKKQSSKYQGVGTSQQFEDQDLEQINKMIDDEPVLLTQEEEQQIREVASDINEKAFYGKLLKKQHAPLIEANFTKLSPRSREIASIMNIIKESFQSQGEPPITTTDFYRIGKMLGRGAFGKVNLAMHKLVRKLVAIKSLNKEVLTDEDQKAKLMKEVSLLLKLRHNHVVKIYETIETDKHIIIVMELCAGGDLLNYVRKRRKLKEPSAKVIFKQIIDGLCYIHSKYIAHRDIKLDNILLDGKGNVKIGDFGVSKQCQKGQRMTEQCGTPAYIAPEILKDRGYSFNVDIWSAGVVLFAMLYGTVPFKANNMEELHRLIIKGKYTLKDDISAEGRNLLRGLLEVNPEKRLTIPQIYRHKWLQDIDPDIELFNDQEREMIKKEYTYNDPRRYNRNENEEPVDCFTEHNLESVYNSLKNATSKSVILAPFNSTQSEMETNFKRSMQDMICEKMMVINFARRCREIDRQYEFNNNGDLDNGVYHKYVYNSDEDDGDNDNNEGGARKDNLNCQLSEPMLVSEKPKVRRGGRASIENSFDNSVDPKAMNERQVRAKKIQEGSQMQHEIKKRNDKRNNQDFDKEMMQTYETYQTQFNNKLDEEKVGKLVQFGYPREYVLNSLDEFDPNHCTAGYYLMCMDQNYC